MRVRKTPGSRWNPFYSALRAAPGDPCCLNQGVGGSNPLSSNKSLLINKMRSMFSLAATALDVSERSMESVASASGEHLVELAVGPGLPCFGCCDS